MKRMVVIMAVSLFIKSLAIAGEVQCKIKGSYFYPSDKAFQDIYGGGMMYGVEASTEILKNLEMWVEADYFSRKGELSFTKEETKLKIIPAGGGARYIISRREIIFYCGLGVNYYRYREVNRLGTVNWGRLGAVGKVGGFVKVKEKMFIDLYLNYSYCRMKPADFAFNVGGLEAGIGIACQLSEK
jgi:hypothetical protein